MGGESQADGMEWNGLDWIGMGLGRSFIFIYFFRTSFMYVDKYQISYPYVNPSI